MNEDVGNAFAINKDDIIAFVGVQEVAAVWTDSMHEVSALFGNEDVSIRIYSEVGKMMEAVSYLFAPSLWCPFHEVAVPAAADIVDKVTARLAP